MAVARTTLAFAISAAAIAVVAGCRGMKFRLPKTSIPKFHVPKASIPNLHVPKSVLSDFPVSKTRFPDWSKPDLSDSRWWKAHQPNFHLPDSDLSKVRAQNTRPVDIDPPAAQPARGEDAVPEEKITKDDGPDIDLPDIEVSMEDASSKEDEQKPRQGGSFVPIVMVYAVSIGIIAGIGCATWVLCRKSRRASSKDSPLLLRGENKGPEQDPLNSENSVLRRTENINGNTPDVVHRGPKTETKKVSREEPEELFLRVGLGKPIPLPWIPLDANRPQPLPTFSNSVPSPIPPPDDPIPLGWEPSNSSSYPLPSSSSSAPRTPASILPAPPPPTSAAPSTVSNPLPPKSTLPSNTSKPPYAPHCDGASRSIGWNVPPRGSTSSAAESPPPYACSVQSPPNLVPPHLASAPQPMDSTNHDEHPNPAYATPDRHSTEKEVLHVWI